MKKRCFWGANLPEVLIRYHDEEWGVPLHDDNLLFEMLCLGAFQAGLSFMIVLRKRGALRKRFHGFNIETCARMQDFELEDALTDPEIIRNRNKVYAIRYNARAALKIIKEFGSLEGFLWDFVGGRTIINGYRTLSDLPTVSRESDVMSRELKKLGFTFVGSTICYAFMQAVGMVNDHTVDCFRYAELGGKEPDTKKKKNDC
jgi:DNA-3-methyladenine glycosylase I